MQSSTRSHIGKKKCALKNVWISLEPVNVCIAMEPLKQNIGRSGKETNHLPYCLVYPATMFQCQTNQLII